MPVPLDDLGAPVDLPAPPRRIVSLVPSLTEALAAAVPDRLVGATDWCTRPAELDVTRVRGTKNPDRAAIESLHPDLVVANQEENRELDVRRLRDAGVPVWVTRIETLDDAFAAMRRLFVEVLRGPEPVWLTDARSAWDPPAPPDSVRVAVPIWRDPWMVVGPRTFTDDLLRRLGAVNVFGGSTPDGDRYPTAGPAEIAGHGPDLVLLPDEPYVFTADDGPEAFPGIPTALVEGRLLTWYGPSLVEARAALTVALDNALFAAVADPAVTPPRLRRCLDLLLGRDVAGAAAAAFEVLSRPPRYRPERGLIVDPHDRAREAWARRVAAAAALLARPGTDAVRAAVDAELAESPEFAADVRAAGQTVAHDTDPVSTSSGGRSTT